MSKKTDARIKSTTKSMSKVVMKNLTVSVNDKDFSEALSVTRTLFKDIVTKTSIVEASLACAASSSESFSCSKIASFIINTLHVNDCFHKREQNKNKDALKSTILRVRHHVVDTIKTNHIADTLYSYDKTSDSITFSELYIKTCKKDVTYRKKVSAFIKRVKTQYFVSTKKVKKTDKKTFTKKQIKAFKASRIALDSDVCRLQAHAMNLEFNSSKAA